MIAPRFPVAILDHLNRFSRSFQQPVILPGPAATLAADWGSEKQRLWQKQRLREKQSLPTNRPVSNQPRRSVAKRGPHLP